MIRTIVFMLSCSLSHQIQANTINENASRVISHPFPHNSLPRISTLTTSSSESLKICSKAQQRLKPFENHRHPGGTTRKVNSNVVNTLTSIPNKEGHKKDFAFVHRPVRSVFHVRWNPNERFVVESREKPAVNTSKLALHPRLKLSKNTKLTLNPKIYLCHDPDNDKCHNKTTAFRQQIIRIFEKSLSETANETNFYNVDFKPMFSNSFEEQYYPSTCLIMDAEVRVLRRKDPPFHKLEFGKIFPKQKLFRQIDKIKTCVIVSSAGSMSGSKLGRFIDTHDVVMRFNDAPTYGFEVDVGTKTTIRVVNSQVVTKPTFNFTWADIFRNVTIAAWDPGKYNNSLNDWITSADYDLFSNYKTYRLRHPKSRAFLIDPHSIWRLWQSLQIFIGNRPIRKNPPSSGFIGLALLLPHCPHLDFVEYIPSTRLNGRCHYYSKELNSACTFGAWHPLAAEKLMALDMNLANDTSVFQHGILRIRRPDRLLCGFSFLGY